MDLNPITTPPAPEEREAIDRVLGPDGRDRPEGLAATQGRRHLLLPALHAAQAQSGYLSPGALGYIGARLHVPPAEVYGVASFYALFSLEPRAPKVLHVCDDLACKAKGADGIKASLAKAPSPHQAWLPSPCLGLCEHAPAGLLMVAGSEPFERGLGGLNAAQAQAALTAGTAAGPPRTVPRQARSELRLLKRVGLVDPSSLDDYRAHGGYQALRRAFELGPAGVIREVSDAKLVGRGGAAFPTGRKWAAVASQAVRPHYLVCNADESEPGTFKDRILMEEDPFALIEAMTIAAYATASEQGYIYIRGEYPLAAARLEHALQVAHRRGLLGARVMDQDFRFELEVRRGAGAYICGEETALFNSLEGFRGEPRNKPPFPVESGLFGKPTAINNVETLVSVLEIVEHGGAQYATLGTAGSVGTKLFCLSGHVQHPGIYEVELGLPLSQLIAMAGGVAPGRTIQAVLLGGAAGAYLSPAELDVPLTFEDTRKIGATLGSGVVLVLDDQSQLLELVRRTAEFFRDESCGQCVPCRVGTVRVEEMLVRIQKQKPLGSVSEERALLKELGQAMRDASICGLGQTATTAVESAVQKFNLFGGTP